MTSFIPAQITRQKETSVFPCLGSNVSTHGPRGLLSKWALRQQRKTVPRFVNVITVCLFRNAAVPPSLQLYPTVLKRTPHPQRPLPLPFFLASTCGQAVAFTPSQSANTHRKLKRLKKLIVRADFCCVLLWETLVKVFLWLFSPYCPSR